MRIEVSQWQHVLELCWGRRPWRVRCQALNLFEISSKFFENLRNSSDFKAFKAFSDF